MSQVTTIKRDNDATVHLDLRHQIDSLDQNYDEK